MQDNMVKVEDNNFETAVVKSDMPILVDFWAAWCGPCKMIAPVVDEIATDYSGKMKVGKLNVDENPNTASKFGIMSIPTLILFKDGKAIEKIIGFKGKKDFDSILSKHF